MYVFKENETRACKNPLTFHPVSICYTIPEIRHENKTFTQYPNMHAFMLGIKQKQYVNEHFWEVKKSISLHTVKEWEFAWSHSQLNFLEQSTWYSIVSSKTYFETPKTEKSPKGCRWKFILENSKFPRIFFHSQENKGRTISQYTLRMNFSLRCTVNTFKLPQKAYHRPQMSRDALRHTAHFKTILLMQFNWFFLWVKLYYTVF